MSLDFDRTKVFERTHSNVSICKNCGTNYLAHVIPADVAFTDEPHCPSRRELANIDRATLKAWTSPLAFETNWVARSSSQPTGGEREALGVADHSATAGELVDVKLTYDVAYDEAEQALLERLDQYRDGEGRVPAADLIREMRLDRQSRQEALSRTAIVSLREGDILDFFGLGEEFDVLAVWAVPERNCICIRVRADHLNVVPPGSNGPDLEGVWEREVHIASLVDEHQNPIKVPYYRMKWMPMS